MIESKHRSFPFGTAIACGNVGADANSQHTAGKSLQVCARLISQAMATVVCTDTDDEYEKYTGYHT